MARKMAASRLSPYEKRPRRPAEGSLYTTLRQHPRQALFVCPDKWTDFHARLLGVEFHELSACDKPKPHGAPRFSPTEGHLQPSETIKTLCSALDEMLGNQDSRAINTTLKILWPDAFHKPLNRPKLYLFDGNKVYHDVVSVHTVWNFPSDASRGSSQRSSEVPTRPTKSSGPPSLSLGVHNPTDSPMMCYIGQKNLALMSLESIGTLGVGTYENGPASQLMELQPMCFPGIFLAMAQRHFYPDSTSKPRSEFKNLKLRILTHDDNPPAPTFLVYTGYVTSQFLQWFHDPLSSPRVGINVPGIKIEYTRVPIWPILGLRERLGKAIGEDFVGKFDPSQMKTWLDDGSFMACETC